MNRRKLITGIAAAPLAAVGRKDAGAAPGPDEIPTQRPFYPRSRLLAGLEWTGPAHKYPGSGTDMHWHTWGSDGALYVVDDDGSNFGLPWNFAHLLRVTGQPPHHKVEEVSRFPGLNRYSMRRHLYVNGALAVDRRLYVAAYEYDTHDPARLPTRIVENNTQPQDPVGFGLVDAISHLGGVASLMYSDDGGQTWQNLPKPNAPHFLGPRFAGLAFVGFGPGYTRVPPELDGYVYAISNDGAWENGDHVFLARVPRDRVLDRSAWRFYGGRNDENRPAWIEEEQYARPILSDPGYVGHPTMTYNPGLRRFLLAFGSDSVPHSYATPPEVMKRLWHRARELQVYEGPTPWGPWGLVHYDRKWEGEHVAYLPHIPPNWLSDDGLSGTLLFSGDYSMHPRPKGHESYYGFMTRPFRLRPR